MNGVCIVIDVQRAVHIIALQQILGV